MRIFISKSSLLIYLMLCMCPGLFAQLGGGCGVNSVTSTTSDSRCSPGNVTLSASLSGTNGNQIRWYTSSFGGTPIHTGTSYTVYLSSSTTYYVEAYNTSTGCASTFRSGVAGTIIDSSISGGSINYSGSTICYGSSHSIISNTQSATNGSSYQWQKTAHLTSNWSDIPGEISASYTPSTLLYGSTSYRRKSSKTSSCGTSIAYSNVTTVFVYDDLTAGNVNGNQTICVGNTSASITASAASGGAGNYSYTWEKRASGGQWQNIGGGITLSPSEIGSLTQTTEFRRKVTDSQCGIDYTNISTVTVNPMPSLASGTNQSRCGSGSLTLTANPGSNGNTVRWYSASSGGTLLHTGTSYPISSLSSTTTYYAASHNSSTGCTDTDRIAIQAIINPIPSLASGTNQSRCGSGSLTLTANPGNNSNTIRWYSASSGGTLLHTGTSYPISSLSSTTTYYAASHNSSTGCTDPDRKALQAIINPIPSLASGTNQSRCGSGSLTLTANPGINGNTIRWYSSGGTLLHTGTSYPISSLSSTTTYYAASHNSSTGCTDTDRIAIQAIINPLSVGGTTSGSTEAFGVATGSLTLSGYTGSIIKWQYRTTGDWIDIVNTNTIQNYTNVQETTQYQAIVQNANCDEVASSIATVTILNVPDLDLGVSQNLRPGQKTTLSASSGHANYRWFHNNIEVKNGPNNELETDQPGIYKVTVTSSGGALHATGDAVIASQLEMNENAVVTYTYRVPLINVDNPFIYDISEQVVSSQIYDGLGRPIQMVALQQSPNQEDLVSPVKYDELGRKTKSYLPFVDASLNQVYKPNALKEEVNGTYSGSQHHDYYLNSSIHSSDKAYSEIRFESSPLNRPLEQGAPGDGWQIGQNTVTFKYDVADSAEVLSWDFESILTDVKNVYEGGSLFKNTTTDEDNNQTIEFTDKLGRTILKKSQVDASTWAETYYIFDIYGSLRVVLPPEATARLDTEFFGQSAASRAAFLNTWAFLYDYDGRNRMTMKKVPGADSVFMVYDQWDRLVLTQDGVQRASNTWLFTKYDALNRPIITGLATINGTTQQVRDGVAASNHRYDTLNSTLLHQYSNQSYPTSAIDEYLTLTYYDDYVFQSHTDWTNAGLGYTSPTGLTQNNSVKGQVTGTLTKAGDGIFIRSVSYYDDKYRVIQTQSTNHLGGTDVVTNYYDFIGQVDKTITDHSNGADSITITRRFEYDHADRPLTTTHQINDEDEIVLSQNSYNELGELIEKDLHGGTGVAFAQSLDYTYNIRGWLTSMNSSDLSGSLDGDLFGMELHYNTNPIDGTNTNFNGNISAMQWSDPTGSGSNDSRAYNYSYDQLNRLTGADHRTNGTDTASFDVDNLQYDLNGNIESLQRRAQSTTAFMDDLSYTYSGNQLLTVSDAATDTTGFYDGNTTGDDYAYDANGNMVKDLNKGIDTIYYNHLNLPTTVILSNSEGSQDSITYLYDAAGIKLQQVVYKGGTLQKTTDYVGEFIYETDTSGIRALELIQHEEGRIVPELISMVQTPISNTSLELTLTLDGNANDASGNGRNGTVNGAILVEGMNGTANGAYDFDGADDYIDLSTHDTDFTALSTGTFSIWFKTDINGLQAIAGIGNTTNDIMDVYVGGNVTGGVANESIGIYLKTGGSIRLHAYVVKGQDYYNDGEWHHLIFSVGTSSNAIYIDGVQESLTYLTGDANTSGYFMNVNSSNFAIGRRYYPSSPLYFNGSLDEINIFSRALSESEILALYNGTNPGEEITVMKPVAYDYQYHLKDHLGNVRVTFSTTPESYTMVETFETGEDNGWQDLHRHTSASANTTPGGDEVERLQSGQTGAMIFLSMNKGDTVDLSVQANYESAPSNNTFVATVYSSLFGTYNSSFAGGEAGSTIENEFNDVLSGTNMAGKGSTSSAPRAFLNYIFFDEEMNYVTAGFQQISTAALGTGVHETISINDIIAEQEGYILAYLSNENQEAVNVHWDDFTVYHGKTNVVSTQDYYPGGATYNEYQRTASTPNNYKYQGKEWEKQTQLYDFDARMYDPYIWRTPTIDPLASEFYDQSPYSFQRNNPIRFIDPTGMAPEDWVEAEEGTIYWDDNATSQETTKAGETYLGKNVLVATHNRDANGDEAVNTATFKLYTEDGIVVPSTGPVATIQGNTVPSDTEKFGTLAEGIYPARFQARASKPGENALIINEGGELPTVNGNPNKANSDNLTEVFFHRGNPYQESLRDSGGNPVWSHGCLTGGCGQGSLDRFNTFMENAQDFNGVLYLKSKPAPPFSIQSLMPKK